MSARRGQALLSQLGGGISNQGSIGPPKKEASGKALAAALTQAGCTITTILDRNPGAARSLAQSFGVARSGSEVSLIGKDRILLIIAVPDDEIAKVDHALAKHLPQMDLAGVVHTSGALLR